MSIVDRILDGQFTLIAEVGVNYYDIAQQRNISPLEAAKQMCIEAKRTGAHAVKFQSYKAETLAIKDSPSYWDTSEESTASQFELFKKYDAFGEKEYREIAAFCNEIGIGFCSTAFDFASADYLEPLMDIYKVSSSDITNIPFIEYQAAKNKPMMVSVGASDLDEIRCAYEAIRGLNNQPLILCHCVLEYPTPFEHANLSRIKTLASCFPDAILGYSDHCKPDASYDVIKTAYSLGAHVVEKHFTLDKRLPGNDHYHAMDPDDVRRIVSGISFIEEILGDADLVHSPSESSARENARRSIVSALPIRKGDVISKEMLTFKRPGSGLSPTRISEVVGSIAACDIDEDCIISNSMLE